MEVAVLTKVRNGPLIRWRRQNQLSQMAAAARANVPLCGWNSVEKMRFEIRSTVEAASKIAEVLDVPLEEVMPRELVGKSLWLDQVLFRRVSADRMLATEYQERMTLPSPEDAVGESEENVKRLLKDKRLTDRERLILRRRFGIGCQQQTLREVGKELGLLSERVRQIEAEALCKLRTNNPLSPLFTAEVVPA